MNSLAKLSREEMIAWLEHHLWEKRMAHVLGTEAMARQLAEQFQVDSDKSALAGLVHDCAKWMKNEEILQYAEAHGIIFSPEDLQSPHILHSLIGGTLAQEAFGIEDIQVLNAIRYHTLGHPTMDDVAKVVFIADKIETHTRQAPLRDAVLNTLEKHKTLNAGLIECYRKTILYLTEKTTAIHPTTLAVWNQLVN